jgi:hypothetical protein
MMLLTTGMLAFLASLEFWVCCLCSPLQVPDFSKYLFACAGLLPDMVGGD